MNLETILDLENMYWMTFVKPIWFGAKMSIKLTGVTCYRHFNGQASPLFFGNNEQSSGFSLKKIMRFHE